MTKQQIRQKSCMTTTTSPHFDICKKKKCSRSNFRTAEKYQQHHSTVRQSLQVLGPLIYTWNCNLYASRDVEFCHRPVHSRQVCSSCELVIEKALHPFADCPLFLKSSQQQSLQQLDQSCIEIVGQHIQDHSVRHLCPNQCFMRAFLPARDYVFFRRQLLGKRQRMGGSWSSLEHLFDGWTCKLVGSRHDDRPSKRSTPKTLFFSSSDQQCYSNVAEATRALEATSYKSQQGEHSKKKMLSIAKATLTIKGNRVEKQPRSLFLSSKDALVVKSPLGLLEELFAHDPWQLLLSAILLNRTQRKQADLVLYEFLQQWPTPLLVLEKASSNDIARCIAPLGIHVRRSRGILIFCSDYVALLDKKKKSMKRAEFYLTRSEIMGMYHCGEYAADVYEIFIQKQWRNVQPKDHALKAYVEWKLEGR